MIGWGLHYFSNSLRIVSRLLNPSWFFHADNKDFTYKIYIASLTDFLALNWWYYKIFNAAKEFRIVENVLWTRKQHLPSTSQVSNFVDPIISQEIVDVYYFYLWMRKQKYLKINLVTNFLVKIQHVKHLLAINFGG